MMTQKIERIDTIPLIIAILTKMRVQQTVDNIFKRHGNWSGLSYGQLAVFFVTYLLHSMTHRFSAMESWLNQHKTVIEQVTGWQIGEKDATDDRLGIMTQVLGGTDEGIYSFQTLTAQSTISAYQLPTQIIRYDTTSFNVYHHPENAKKGILQFGHSKNFRPDLLQYSRHSGGYSGQSIHMVSD